MPQPPDMKEQYTAIVLPRIVNLLDHLREVELKLILYYRPGQQLARHWNSTGEHPFKPEERDIAAEITESINSVNMQFNNLINLNFSDAATAQPPVLKYYAQKGGRYLEILKFMNDLSGWIIPNGPYESYDEYVASASFIPRAFDIFREEAGFKGMVKKVNGDRDTLALAGQHYAILEEQELTLPSDGAEAQDRLKEAIQIVLTHDPVSDPTIKRNLMKPDETTKLIESVKEFMSILSLMVMKEDQREVLTGLYAELPGLIDSVNPNNDILTPDDRQEALVDFKNHIVECLVKITGKGDVTKLSNSEEGQSQTATEFLTAITNNWYDEKRKQKNDTIPALQAVAKEWEKQYKGTTVKSSVKNPIGTSRKETSKGLTNWLNELVKTVETCDRGAARLSIFSPSGKGRWDALGRVFADPQDFSQLKTDMKKALENKDGFVNARAILLEGLESKGKDLLIKINVTHDSPKKSL